MNRSVEYIRERLFALQDISYRDFQAALMPTVQKEKIIGVRTPALRSLAKEIAKSPHAEGFLRSLPHKYYEEDNLHALLLEREGDITSLFSALDEFLPFVDNWATCDMLSPKAFCKKPEELLPKAYEWMKSEHTYTVRFGIGVLMRHYLDGDFRAEHADAVALCCCDEYYVNMMVAWYFATALAKQYDAILPYLQERKLSAWCHNRTISKAIDSYRITPRQKDCLRTLRIKIFKSDK